MKLLITTQAVDKNHPILSFFHGWILEFAKHFEEVHVLCLQKGDYTLPEHVFVYSLGKEIGESRLKYTYRFYKYFWHIFFTVKVSYVFFHMGAIYNIMAAPFYIVRRFMHTKFYWWKAHGHLNFEGKLAYLFVDRVYTSTASGFSIASPKRHIIGQAIDSTLFTLNIVSSDRPYLIFVGRIMPVKKIEDFLDTYLLLRDQGYNIEPCIVGPVGDDSYFEEMLLHCKKNSIPPEIFIGSKTQSELVDLYGLSTVFLNTSLTHSMDKTVLEAMLCGAIPVTANRAFKEILSPEGLYLPEATPQQYADKISLLFKSPKDKMRRSLRERVIAKHSLHTFSVRIFNTQNS